mmetsp:Transcript_59363/g.127938  ORF Transcript_59363/g.127938 Transcript_59363/m.127938 type:complete len:702 (+) Transcript_59363:86-2191(+)
MRTFVAASLLAVATATSSTTTAQANPIRRVVSLLQAMAEKIEAEGKRQDKAMQKYICYCKNNKEELVKSISDGKATIELLTSKIEAATNAKTQAEADLKQAQADRAEAQKANADAEAAREKEASEFAEESGEMKANIDAMAKAIPAIEQGMAGSFLQTVGRIAANSADLSAEDKDAVSAFLQSATGSTYEPASGQIVGILKQMQDTMKADLKEATTKEAEALADFNELVASQNKAIQAATDAIEEKTEQSGSLAVQIVQLKNEKSDVAEQLEADTGYSEQLGKDCEQQTKDYAAVKQTRADELLAIADTVKILNDDDVLDLFKKALPASSLLQVETSRREVAAQALKLVRAAGAHPKLDLIAIALRGKKVNFDKVIEMIDAMEDTLKKEQVDDDSKKAYCAKEFDETEDRFKDLAHDKERLDQAHSNLDATIKDTKEKIAALEQGIKDLDKAVAEATENRKDEHDDYVSSTAQDQAAVQILEFAKNRLAKFYQPKQYKEAPKRVLSDEEKMYSAYGGDIGTTPAPAGLAGTGVSVGFVQIKQHTVDAPPAAPQVGGYEKQKGGGVMGMIDRMINDMKTEMNQHKLEEEDAQEDYEKMMQDSAEKRAADSKAVSENESALAEAQSDLATNKDNRRANSKNNAETHGYNQDLHQACDFLMDNYDTRKSARTEELESLDKAKAVLSGADLSLVQTKSSAKFLAA